MAPPNQIREQRRGGEKISLEEKVCLKKTEKSWETKPEKGKCQGKRSQEVLRLPLPVRMRGPEVFGCARID